MTALSAVDQLTVTTSTQAGRLLVCYLPVGDPEATSATPAFYAEHGVDVVEAGLPVRNPVMDGPEVASSMARALDAAAAGGPSPIQRLRNGLANAGDVACVWMSYHRAPDRAYLERVQSTGAGGVLLPDADPVELGVLAGDAGLTAVPFLKHAPTEPQVLAAARAAAYVMLAAADGITGERARVASGNAVTIERLRSRGVTAPILLGFGLSNPDHVRHAVGLGADGVIVGSACVRAARDGAGSLSHLLTKLRRALDAA